MPNSNESSSTTEERSVLGRILDWIIAAVKGGVGVACLAGGGLLGLIANALFENDPYWALGLGGVSLIFLALGGTVLFRLATAENKEESRTGFMDLVDGLAGLISRAMWGAVNLVGLLYASGFLLAAGYLGSWALHVYRDSGVGGPFLLVAGMALGFLVVPGKFALAYWRQWRESRHTYEKAPGAYRRAWSSPRMETTGFPPSAEVLGGFTSTSIESWWNVLLWAVFCWAALALIGFYMGWVVALMLAPLALSGASSTSLLYRGARHRLRHGTAVFEMDTWPATVGTRLSGTVETDVPLDGRPADGFRVVLTCYERKGRSSYQTHWYAEEQVTGQPGPEGTLSLPVSFDLPDVEPPSTLERMSSRVVWRLEVQTDALSPPYHQSLEVPVFPADPSAQNHTPTPERE